PCWNNTFSRARAERHAFRERCAPFSVMSIPDGDNANIKEGIALCPGSSPPGTYFRVLASQHNRLLSRLIGSAQIAYGQQYLCSHPQPVNHSLEIVQLLEQGQPFLATTLAQIFFAEPAHQPTI